MWQTFLCGIPPQISSWPTISQILQEQGSKQLQLDSEDTDNRVQLKLESGG